MKNRNLQKELLKEAVVPERALKGAKIFESSTLYQCLTESNRSNLISIYYLKLNRVSDVKTRLFGANRTFSRSTYRNCNQVINNKDKLITIIVIAVLFMTNMTNIINYVSRRKSKFATITNEKISLFIAEIVSKNIQISSLSKE